MNKKVLLISSVLLTLSLIILAISIILINCSKDNNIYENTNQKNNTINNSFLTLMLEDETGNYVKSTSNTWPSGNYAFNETLSRCENGGELRWDRENGIVNLLSNKSDACYVYFDLYNVVNITNVDTTKTTNSVTLSVTVDAGENPVATYYFSMDGGNSYETSTSPNYTFSNLTPNTTYTFQVYAVDTFGYESNEEVIEVTTDNYVNPVVNSVTATNVTNNSITVSVNASAGTNNVQTYYYSINNGSYASSSSNTYTFSGLSAGETYNIRVYVVDSNNVQSNVYNLSVQTDDTVLLADYIKGLYTYQGANGLYYHTSSLANSAADNSYRYAGANPNNYVCFGSDAATCPAANLYRIIGVFDNEVKLIKNTSIADYAWESDWDTQGNTWNSSTKPDIRTTLNSTFLNTFSSTWQNKIATHAFKVGGMSLSNGRSNGARTAYNYEVGANSGSTTDSMKIGLMYVSDYYYGATNTYWTYPGYNSNGNDYRQATGSNWLYLVGAAEWTISRISDYSGNAFVVNSKGIVSSYGTNFTNAVRPVFYLTSSTQYVSGSGTSTDPIIIN